MNTVDVRRVARAALPLLVTSVALLVVLRLAVRGTLAPAAISVLAPLATCGMIAAAFRIALVCSNERSAERPLHRRHGFWLLAFGTWLGLPWLGRFGLVDPWETHYAEVARGMLARHDFVSTWWANEGWFMSKPVLLFWLEALSMRVLGVAVGPDAVVAHGAHPEWALRLPGFVFMLVGSYVLYFGISRTTNRRAGLLSGVLLWTMPGFAVLSHQAITDTPLLGGLAASLGLVLCAVDTPEGVEVQRARLQVLGLELTVDASHLLALLFLITTASQVVGLATENLDGLHLTRDWLLTGTPGACGLPGQQACVRQAVAIPRLQPVLQALGWSTLVALATIRIAAEKRKAHLLAIAAWWAAGLAAMAKGPVGLVVPVAAMASLCVARRSLRPLLRFECITAALVCATMILPWYVAEFVRHGRVFIDELVFRHMLGRTMDHLHDTNEGDDVGIAYFVRQLGYATFPWTGLAATALFSARGERSRHGTLRVVLYGSGLAGFALVSAMRTKFHHYGLIALPSIAGILGVWLDERLRIPRQRPRSARHVVFAVVGVLVTLLVAADLLADRGAAHFINLATYRYARPWPLLDALHPWLVLTTATAAVGIALFGWQRLRIYGVAACTACAIVLAVVLLDHALPTAGVDGGQRALFDAYYRLRGVGPKPPIVAYQLNWKGENFYSGNRAALFIASGPPLRTYLDGRRHDGDAVFFVTERGRVQTLRAELGTVRSFQEIDSGPRSAQFALVRVEL